MYTTWVTKRTCPKVNKFEQVSSDDHLMSLAEGWGQGWD